ncbi:MAG TPA: NADH-ubiquinone oxidoreductase-F iron-sulfur binding region domain-containing protein [Euzebya sp.]|nr:NADH-ubiquinone oxidoreductase-F iron-sulfur binding region domain-containing protein [Euzebya sp.]
MSDPADNGPEDATGGGYLLPDAPITSLDGYEAAGGGEGLWAALEREPAEVVAEVSRSGLRGRGGAGFPTGVKWRSIVQAGVDADCPVYLVCNGAEGEPGTYKDRALFAQNPYQLLEGVLIALHALGAETAFIGIKERFTAERQGLSDAHAQMRGAGWEGIERVQVVAGPDEYLFGEEKAMLEVIEGKLPLPRILPPFMTGLFATMDRPNPTAVNNVETLSHVPHILAKGATWFRRWGTEEAPGTMLFTVIGDVQRPGVHELAMGTSLRTLLVDIAGASDIKAIYSGVSNAVIMPGLLDLPMDFESFKEAGTGLGSGGFIVYDSSHCMVRVAATLAHFLAIESCGQCLACKLGTAEIASRLTSIDRGEGSGTDIDQILDRSVTVTDLARCGLPVGAQVLRTTIQAFREEFIAHLGQPCPSTAPAVVPKIEHLDTATGAVVLDHDYHRKRDDWSYAEGGQPGIDSILTVVDPDDV